MKNIFFGALTLSLSCFAFAEPVSEPHAASQNEKPIQCAGRVLAEPRLDSILLMNKLNKWRLFCTRISSHSAPFF